MAEDGADDDVHPAFLAELPEQNPDPVLRLGPDLTVVYANPAARKAFGALGVRRGASAPAPLRGIARRALEAIGPIEAEVACGTTTYSLRCIANASVVNVYGQDVTARKHVERALRDSQQLLRSTMDHFPTVIAFKDREGRFLDVNHAVEAALGLPKVQIIGRTVHEFLPKSAADVLARHAGEVMATGRAVQHEEVTPLPSGTLYYVDTSFPLVDSDGRIYGTGHISHDVTQLKRADAALRASEEKLRRYADFVEHAPVLVRDLDDRIVIWNEGMHRLYGWGRDEAVGRTSHELLRTQFPQDRSLIADVLRREGRWEGELTRRHRDGHEVVVASLCVLHRTEADQPEAVIEVNSDITARKTAERALVEADRRRTEFLAVLSHELRNPLAPIRNSVYLLDKMHPDTAQAARARRVIRRQSEHLATLVDDLLDVTRIASGKIQLARESLDLRNVVRRTSEDHRSVFDENGIALGLEVPGAPVWADVDPTRIAQVVGNLLNNAGKFTPQGGAVTVRLRSRDSRAEISVRDNGVGMAPEQLTRLFQPFSQEDRSLARSRGGLGLGLALSRGLVELHGGSLTARSDGPAKGAEFLVELPLAVRPSDARTGARLDRAAPTKRRVLLIDDNADAARSLADVLELFGHEVSLAADGAGGIRLAREQRPDVVICDLGLPDVDGFQIAKTLRGDPSLRSTRLVALSGYGQPEDKQRALRAGFEVHLTRPAAIDDLKALLEGAP